MHGWTDGRATFTADASVFVAGSNPNADVGATVNYNLPYPAEYNAEIFYPPYWGKKRPEPTGIPTVPLTYGGGYFDISLKNGSYPGSANDAASKTKCVLLRSGFTTHGMNMGQRYLQLNSTYTVADNGDITMHCSQLPPNANLFTPGPSMFYIVTDGVPSIGKSVMVGNGQFGAQPTSAVLALPAIQTSSKLPDKQANNKDPNDPKNKTFPVGILVAAVAGGIGAAALLGGLIFFICRKRRAANRTVAGRPFDSLGEGFAGNAAAPAGFTPGPPLATRGMQNQYGTPYSGQGYSAAGSEMNLPFEQNRNYDAYPAVAGPPPGAAHSYNPSYASSTGGGSPYQAPRQMSSTGGDSYYDPYRNDQYGGRR